MDIEIVPRPANVIGRQTKYFDHYEALHITVESGQAIKVTLTRQEIGTMRARFQSKNPSLRVCSRTMPDGIYLWAERRT